MIHDIITATKYTVTAGLEGQAVPPRRGGPEFPTVLLLQVVADASLR
jgi:hypothetical protein